MWTRNSPTWRFSDATFERRASAFDNPDYVDVVIHSYRHRLGFAPGYPPYAVLEKRLAELPTIGVPTITMDGDADGVVPATDGASSAARFSGRRQHRVLASVGHNPPQEQPESFAAAVGSWYRLDASAAPLLEHWWQPAAPQLASIGQCSVAPSGQCSTVSCWGFAELL